MKKIFSILLTAFPILIMIGLIPVVTNDYTLTVIYIAIIFVALGKKRNHHNLPTLIFGFIIMLISESIFVSTGVETFNRHSLLGLMPLWLPFLWAYVFVAIKRAVEILG